MTADFRSAKICETCCDSNIVIKPEHEPEPSSQRDFQRRCEDAMSAANTPSPQPSFFLQPLVHGGRVGAVGPNKQNGIANQTGTILLESNAFDLSLSEAMGNRNGCVRERY